MTQNSNRGANTLQSAKRAEDNQEDANLARRNIEIITQLEESAKIQRTKTDRIADAIAAFCGSMTFVWVHIIWFGGWIFFNTFPGLPHIDQFPFTFLTLVVSLEAIFLSTFILISQNHETRLTEKRNHLDLQINLLSEQENTQMLKMLRKIAEKVGVEIDDEQVLAELEQTTQPDKLVRQIEETGSLEKPK